MSWRLPQASTMAGNVDALFDFILWTSVASFLIIVLGKLFFLIRFRRKKVPERESLYLTGHTATEVSVSVILLIWVMVIFYWGWTGYKRLRTAPAGAMEINVIGKQWLWEIQYADGRRLTNELVVPKGKPVKLIMTSKDVLHSFFVPDFRVKQDVIPNTYTSLWFEATETGEHPIYCAEYCGAAHSGMLGTVRVLEPQEFERWQLAGFLGEAAAEGEEAKPPKNLAEKGREIFMAKGCQACHTTDGSKGLGPTQKGVFGKTEELEGGGAVTVDENYIRESLMEPAKKVVKGFQPIMPTFQGQLTDEEINALIGFIKSLGGK